MMLKNKPTLPTLLRGMVHNTEHNISEHLELMKSFPAGNSLGSGKHTKKTHTLAERRAAPKLTNYSDITLGIFP